MSYIPDYRNETDKLNAEDQLYIQGYRQAVSDMQNFFDSRDEDYAMVDEVVESVKSELSEYMAKRMPKVGGLCLQAESSV